MVAAYRAASLDAADYWTAQSPRTPAHAAVAYAQQQQQRGGRQRVLKATALLLLVVLLLGAAAFVVLGRRNGGGGGGVYGRARTVLVIDAGSSGSRIYAFTWRSPLTPGTLPLVRAVPPSAAADRVPRKLAKSLYDRVETQPGLAAFEGDAAGLRDRALGPLLAWARAVVPRREHARTPLFLLATGGLRRLGPGRAAAVLDLARGAALARSGFLFEHGWARVLSGAEEAAYGWVALNYGAGRLRGGGNGGGGGGGDGPVDSGGGMSTNSSNTSGGSSTGSGRSRAAATATLGTLDLGGASLEVAFEAPGGAVSVTVAGATYRLHTHAFHGYGLNDAFDRGVTLLLAEGGAAATPKAPASAALAGEARGGAAGRAGDDADAEDTNDGDADDDGDDEDGGNAASDEDEDDEEEEEASTQAPSPSPAAAAAAAEATPTRSRSNASSAVSHSTTPRRPVNASSSARALLLWWRDNGHGGAARERSAHPRARRRQRRLSSEHLAGNGVPTFPAPPAGAPAPVVVRHPCLHAGYTARYERTGASAGGGNATAAAAAATPDPPAVTLVGAPDFGACAALARRLAGAEARCADPPPPPLGSQGEASACVLGAWQPRMSGRFVAVTGFYVIAAYFGLPPAAPPTDLPRAARGLCALPWRQAAGAGARGGQQPVANAERYCGWGPYVAALVGPHGLRLSTRDGIGDGDVDANDADVGSKGPQSQQHPQLPASVAVGRGDAGWPLGAALVEAGKVPGFGPRAAPARGSIRASASAAAAAAAAASARPSIAIVLAAAAIAAALLAVAARSAAQRRSGLWAAAARGGAGLLPSHHLPAYAFVQPPGKPRD